MNASHCTNQRFSHLLGYPSATGLKSKQNWVKLVLTERMLPLAQLVNQFRTLDCNLWFFTFVLEAFHNLRMISLWYNSFTPHSPTIIDSLNTIHSLNNFLDNQRFLLSAPSFLYFKHLCNQPFYNDRHTFPCLFVFI